MRRSLALLLSACLAALALLAVSPSAQAATAITGRLVNGHAGTPHPPVAGMTVELLESVGGEPGPTVTTDVTDADGNFSLEPGGSTASRFFVRAVANVDYQAGWVGGTPRWLQHDSAFANRFLPGTGLGNVRAIPGFIRGVVVNSVTKRPVAGVTVTARSQDAIKEVDGADLTDADGRFRINGLTCEDDCYLKINGSARGYETGYRASKAQVVATWGDAAASPLAGIGRVFLDRL
jgi:carboxypeptidase family protein